jgi:hypothetical protein
MEQISKSLQAVATTLQRRAGNQRFGQPVEIPPPEQSLVIRDLGPEVRAVCCVLRSGEVRIAISP